MAEVSGWNISKMTGHTEPSIGGIAYDSTRQRLWLTEQLRGVIQLDLRTSEYNLYWQPLEQPARYGPVAVRHDGAGLVGLMNTRQILRFDAELHPMPEIKSETVIGMAACPSSAAVMTDNSDGLIVSLINEAGLNIWSTKVARGPSANFFLGHTPIFRGDHGIVVLLAQRYMDCITVGYDGKIKERRPIMLEAGSYSEDLVMTSTTDEHKPTGRRYLLDVTYSARTNSLVFLYAPPTCDHGVVIINWPLGDCMNPTAYKISEWTTRIICAGKYLLCYGSETFAGQRKIFPVSLADLPMIQMRDIPALAEAVAPGGNVVRHLFMSKPGHDPIPTRS